MTLRGPAIQAETAGVHRIGLLAFMAFAVAACSDATGSVRGGEPLFDPTPPTVNTAHDGGAGGGSTWTDLYRDFFGPSGQASCAKNGGNCHGGEQETGTIASGMVCSQTSKDDCHNGMTRAASIVPPAGSATPDQTQLYAIVRKAPPNSGGTMPKSSAFAFTPADLQRIADWIKAGARND